MRRLAVLGASGHGKVVAEAAMLAGWGEIEFFDDEWPSRSEIAEWKVVGSTRELLSRASDFVGAVVAIGDCSRRIELQRALKSAGHSMAVIVHPAASVSSRATLGAGSFVAAGAVVCIDVIIGEACIVNTGATVDHDCLLSDAVHVAPGAHLSGAVMVGARAWIGVGAAIRQGIELGADAIVAAGGVVVANVPQGAIVAGVPARLVSRPAEGGG